MIRNLAAALVSFALSIAPALAMQPPPGQTEYVPMKELPPGEQMAAAPLLVAAYAFIWLAVAFYLWTIWRRLNRVETEMRALARKTSQR